MLKQIKITLKFILFFLIALIVKVFYKSKVKENAILLIRPDGIGDYILFRNFIIYYGSVFINEELHLLIATHSESIALHQDSKYVNKFITIDLQKFNTNIIYIFKYLKKIRKNKYVAIIHPVFSRNPIIDLISFVTDAPRKVAFDCDLANSNQWLKNITNQFYTQLIQPIPDPLFEFYRNKEFAQKCLQTQVYVDKPSLKEVPFYTDIIENYVILFPGASEIHKQWSIDNFIKVGKYILENSIYKIVICGAKNEMHLAQELAIALATNRVINLSGATDLIQLASVIHSAQLLISNDTSAIHFAAALDTKFICAIKGEHFGRYAPYPMEMKVDGVHVFPEEIKFKIDNPTNSNLNKTQEMQFSINKVTVDEVIDKILKITNIHNKNHN